MAYIEAQLRFREDGKDSYGHSGLETDDGRAAGALIRRADDEAGDLSTL